jgi:abelson tyrosine-protein kinase 1
MQGLLRGRAARDATPVGGLSTDTWHGEAEARVARGWEISAPKRRRTISSEQHTTLTRTRARVAEAAKSVLGAALDVTHEALVLSSELLQLAPVPGLAEAAKTLLNIWDALEMVDTNRMACMRLVERCADILSGVREEIVDAGPEVAKELTDPIAKLVE